MTERVFRISSVFPDPPICSEKLPNRAPDLALTGATVYPAPAERPLRDATVVIRSGRVAEVRSVATADAFPGVTVLDCSGCTITAGFWNTHVHFHERKWADAAQIPAPELQHQLDELIRFGFTSVFDLSSRLSNTRALRDRIERGEVRGPRILTTGEGLIPLGGAPSPEVFRALGLMETALSEVSDAHAARERARELLDAGVDALKLFVSSPAGGRLEGNAMRAAVEAAHAAGKLVFAHPNDAADVHEALDAGVDVIAHTTPRSGAWDDALLEQMESRAVALIPTLLVWKSLMRHDRLSIRERLVTMAVEQLRNWMEREGCVLFGTDLGAVEYDPADEYTLMAQAGATFPAILASLTTAPAQRIDADATRAEVRAGHCADLTVLTGDPAIDIAALSSVRYTIRAGEVIYAEPTSRTPNHRA
ncbi:MAG TPA: amidohydrolase family protein [Candidatus Cybelea sp.]|nr:amidohydrolase family protein [Candidatus Cybelea sp.]